MKGGIKRGREVLCFDLRVNGSKPVIIAHRGLHEVHPENSTLAFRAAVDAGGDWIEFDVQSTIDGHPVILHDDTLDRTTPLVGRVDRHRADELTHLRLRDHRNRPSDALVPVLMSRRLELANIDANFLVEIKPADSPRLVASTAQAMRLTKRPWMIQSFDRANLLHARRLNLGVDEVLLVGDADQLLAAIDEDWQALHVAQSLVTERLVQLLHDAGRQVGAWTVNDPIEIRRIIKLGVDRIITDQPVLARSLLDE